MNDEPEPGGREVAMPEPGDTITVRSASRPEHEYVMAWAPVSGWVHAEGDCPAYVDFCRHKKEAARMTSLIPRDTTALAEGSAGSLLSIAWLAEELKTGVDLEVAAKWAYNLPVAGEAPAKGVGVHGAEEGIRLMAARGEAIRVHNVRLESETERDAFFMAAATRYIIRDGQEIKLDSVERGKRVSKVMLHSEAWRRNHPGDNPEYINPHWYELGVAKAARNAALALMPGNVKSALLKAGLEAAATLAGERPPQRQQSQPPRWQPASRQPRQQPAAPPPKQEAPPEAEYPQGIEDSDIDPEAPATEDLRAAIFAAYRSLNPEATDRQIPLWAASVIRRDWHNFTIRDATDVLNHVRRLAAEREVTS